jgi:glycosyltransferase involved in cell wall biosynthesis
LQEWIFYSLLKAHKIAFVSEFTRNQFVELKQLKNKQDNAIKPLYQVIYNGFNADFFSLKNHETEKIFKKYNIHFNTPYILHVGSSLPRKNRGLLVKMLYDLGDSWHGVICLAGQKIDENLNILINKYGLQERVISIIKPPHELLVALYNDCDAFVFPSFTEGFGWPLIEAQACGVPVIASALDPMLEVCGGTALHANPNDSLAFADAFKLLTDSFFRDGIIQQGFKNCERFEKEVKVKAYLDFYEQ